MSARREGGDGKHWTPTAHCSLLTAHWIPWLDVELKGVDTAGALDESLG